MNTTDSSKKAQTSAPTRHTLVITQVSEPTAPISHSQINNTSEQLIAQAHTSAEMLVQERLKAEERAREAARYAFD